MINTTASFGPVCACASSMSADPRRIAMKTRLHIQFDGFVGRVDPASYTTSTAILETWLFRSFHRLLAPVAWDPVLSGYTTETPSVPCPRTTRNFEAGTRGRRATIAPC